MCNKTPCYHLVVKRPLIATNQLFQSLTYVGLSIASSVYESLDGARYPLVDMLVYITVDMLTCVCRAVFLVWFMRYTIKHKMAQQDKRS